MEFDNFDKLSEFYKNKKIIKITNKIGLINISNEFEYDGKANSEIRRIVINRLMSSYPNLKSMKAGVHIAWSKTRWRELFNINTRIKKKYYTRCAFTLGDPYREGIQTKMAFIEWNPEFHDVSKCSEDDVIYAYQTTKNNWKVFKCE